jgi:hypothetical protein
MATHEVRITPNGICSDPDCYCDDGGMPLHERSVYVTLSMLHYLAQEARLNLIFLPDGRVWVGGDSNLHQLENQLKEEYDELRKENADTPEHVGLECVPDTTHKKTSG